jgi:hypothetical protein
MSAIVTNTRPFNAIISAIALACDAALVDLVDEAEGEVGGEWGGEMNEEWEGDVGLSVFVDGFVGVFHSSLFLSVSSSGAVNVVAGDEVECLGVCFDFGGGDKYCSLTDGDVLAGVVGVC